MRRRSAATLLALCAVTARAETAGVLEEIIVTAERRQQNLQRVPIAISSIGAELAARIGPDNGLTLAQAVPGLMMNREGNGTLPYIRGVGSSSGRPGNEPAVAMYVDGVYYGSAGAQLGNYNSIERIEVLKGPQGTLFGRNATGGVIQVFTKNPKPEPELKIKAGVAKYRTWSGAVYATGALGDTVSANIASFVEKRLDGWGENFTTGNDSYRLKTHGARAKLRWDAGQRSSVLLNVDYDDYFNQEAVYFRPSPGTTSTARALSIPPPGRYDTFEALDPIASADRRGGSITIDHDFERFALQSISAYREADTEALIESTGASIYVAVINVVNRMETVTQELQFRSPADATIDWTAGLYFLDDESTMSRFRIQGVTFGSPDGQSLAFNGTSGVQLTSSYAAFFQATAPVAQRWNLTLGLRYTEDQREYSAERQNRYADGSVSAAVPAVNSGIEEQWGSWTWRLGIEHQVSDAFMAYAAYNRGIKSGSFDTIVPPWLGPGDPPMSIIQEPVEPEELDAFSTGFKSEWLNQRLRINAEAWYYEYRNRQLPEQIAVGPITYTVLTNAAQSAQRGLDIDITALLMQRLTVNAAFAFADGEFDDYPNGQFMVARETGGNCQFTRFNSGNCRIVPPHYDPQTGNWNLKGNETMVTPPFTMTLWGSYRVATVVGDFDVTLQWYHTGDYFADADNGLGQIAPSHPDNNHQDIIDLLNASITWNSSDGRWGVQGWGRNLSGEDYWSFANESTIMTKQTPAAPRTYGVTVSMNL